MGRARKKPYLGRTPNETKTQKAYAEAGIGRDAAKNTSSYDAGAVASTGSVPTVSTSYSVPAPGSSRGSRSTPTRGDYGRTSTYSAIDPSVDAALIPNAATGLSDLDQGRARKAITGSAKGRSVLEATPDMLKKAAELGLIASPVPAGKLKLASTVARAVKDGSKAARGGKSAAAKAVSKAAPAKKGTRPVARKVERAVPKRSKVGPKVISNRPPAPKGARKAADLRPSMRAALRKPLTRKERVRAAKVAGTVAGGGAGTVGALAFAKRDEAGTASFYSPGKYPQEKIDPDTYVPTPKERRTLKLNQQVDRLTRQIRRTTGGKLVVKDVDGGRTVYRPKNGKFGRVPDRKVADPDIDFLAGEMPRKMPSRKPGARTKQEAAFGRSMKAAGRKVDRSNLRVKPKSRAQVAMEALGDAIGGTAVGKVAGRAVDAIGDIGEDSRNKKFDRAELRRRKASAGTEAFSIARALSGSRGVKEGKVTRFRGKNTFGDPPVEHFLKSERAGKLRTTGKGELATVGQLMARKGLKLSGKELRRAIAKGGTKIEAAGLSPEMSKFAEVLAKETGLSPKTVGAWVLAEQGWAYSEYVAKGYHNWLNIGPHMQRPEFGDPVSAAKLTADSLLGKPGAIKMGAGIPNIVPLARGKSPAEQGRVILDSGWGTVTMPLGSVSVSKSPGAQKRIGQARADLSASEVRAARLGVPGAEDPNAVAQVAREVGAKPTGNASKQTVTRFRNGMMAAKYLEKLQLPYVWGGGHVAGDIDPTTGLDCSGAVSYIGQKMGVMEGSLVSGDFGSVTKPGPGAVTVLYNPTHVLMKIGNKYFGTSSTNPAGGAGFLSKELGDSEMASGKYSIGHFPGMGQKVAKQMGFKTSGAGSGADLPGMSVSDDGLTATVNSGAGVTTDTPRYSDKPILPDSGSYSGGISSGGLPQEYTDLIMGNGTAPGNDVLEEFLNRARSRKRRR